MKSLFLFTLLFFCGDVYGISPLIPYRQGSMWGYANSNGAVIVKPAYSSVSHHGSGSCYIVELNGKYGLLNAKGKSAADLIYDKIDFMPNAGVIITRGGKMGAMDNNGKVLLPCTYDNIEYDSKIQVITFLTGRMMGFYSLETKSITHTQDVNDNQIIQEMVYNDTSGEPSIRNDVTYFVISTDNKNKIGKETKTITFQNGSPIKTEISRDTLAHSYDRIVTLNYYKMPLVLFFNAGKWGVIQDEKITVHALYDSISSVIINNRCETFYYQVMKDEKWGIIDAQGREMVSPLYDEIIHPKWMHESSMQCFDTAHGIVVRNKKKFGIISLTGETVVPLEQDSITLINHHNYYVYHQGNRKGVHGASFKSELIFSLSEELSDLVMFDSTVLMKIVDKNRMITDGWGYKEPYLVGYVASSGLRFYKN